MTPIARIPVIVLSGFLGSGKTTLLNALLRQPELADTAVIVNELGDIAIDQLLVAGSSENLVVLESGCLCCSMLSSFRETLLDLMARRASGDIRPYTQVIVETTGLAVPTPIVQTLLRDSVVTHDYRFGGVMTIVDAVHGVTSLRAYSECSAQVAMADRLLVSKTDLGSGEIPCELVEMLRTINVDAPIERTQLVGFNVQQWLTMGLVLSSSTHEAQALAAPATRHSPVRSDSFIVTGPIGWSGVAAWSDALREFFGRRLLRCKGILEVADIGRPVLLQGVQGVFAAPEPLPGWPDADHRSRLVCISLDIERCELEACLPLLHIEAGTFRPATLLELMT